VSALPWSSVLGLPLVSASALPSSSAQVLPLAMALALVSLVRNFHHFPAMQE